MLDHHPDMETPGAEGAELQTLAVLLNNAAALTCDALRLVAESRDARLYARLEPLARGLTQQANAIQLGIDLKKLRSQPSGSADLTSLPASLRMAIDSLIVRARNTGERHTEQLHRTVRATAEPADGAIAWAIFDTSQERNLAGGLAAAEPITETHHELS
jgi:hypothetical protein